MSIDNALKCSGTRPSLHSVDTSSLNWLRGIKAKKNNERNLSFSCYEHIQQQSRESGLGDIILEEKKPAPPQDTGTLVRNAHFAKNSRIERVQKMSACFKARMLEAKWIWDSQRDPLRISSVLKLMMVQTRKKYSTNQNALNKSGTGSVIFVA